jgi:phosphatidylserine/phosphatidylglycerophosphate/cardiolipin synthase-like enzyme
MLIQKYLQPTLEQTPEQLVSLKKPTVETVKTISEQDLTPEEKEVLVKVGIAMDEKRLPALIDMLFKELETKSPTLQQMNDTQKNALKLQFQTIVETDIKISRNNSYSWAEISNKISEELDSAMEKNPKVADSTILDLNFLNFTTRWNSGFSLFGLFGNKKSEITRAEEVQPLVDGNAAFKKRTEIVSKATQFVNILTWSIYDDNTGKYLIDQVRALLKNKPNVKIRILVDGQTADLDGHNKNVVTLSALDKQVEVIKFYDKTSMDDFGGANSYKGMHRKMLIVDGYEVIAGGMNYGDDYSHMGPAGSQKWRDTDIYFRGGTAAVNAQKLFQKIWNEQIDSNKLFQLPINNDEIVAATKTTETSPIVNVLNSYPGDNSNEIASDILLTNMYAIRRATKSIDIENAYVITVPIMREEIKKALARNPNMQVRILTNSSTSVDEKIVSTPILRSAKELASLDPQRVKIYLKKGDTLHSKFLVVDQEFSMVMSYNLHPRSERVEGEMAVAVLDKNFGQNLSKVFENDIKPTHADLKSANEIVIPDDLFLYGYITRLFFDVH